MSLRDQAAADLKSILEDSSGCGFGWPIKVTNPDGVNASFTGYSNDIGEVIDPETGMAVAGRLAHVTLALASVTACNIGEPAGIADKNQKPWLVTFEGIPNADSRCVFKVTGARPDRTIGALVLVLEQYRRF